MSHTELEPECPMHITEFVDAGLSERSCQHGLGALEFTVLTISYYWLLLCRNSIQIAAKFLTERSEV